jgi:hypothetical protein
METVGIFVAGCASSNPGVLLDGGAEGTIETRTSPAMMNGGDEAGRGDEDSGDGTVGMVGVSDAGAGPDAADVGSGQDAGGGTDANDPLNFSARCTSGMTWNGVTKDQNMRPGEACPTCHSNFYLAGTVYPTGHEPNDCDGVDGLTAGVTVQVTDAAGNVITLYPNGVGNFYTSITITPPFHAKVIQNGKERAMGVSQTNESCNSCHTQSGANGAPGRITLPP